MIIKSIDDYKKNTAEIQNSRFDNYSNWSMFRHDSARTGVTTCYAPDTNRIIKSWNFGKIESSPAIKDRKLYVASIIDNQHSSLHCIDLESGMFLWNTTISGEVISSPAISNESVYIGADNRNFYCFNRENGSERWHYLTGGVIRSSPVIYNNYVCVGSDDGNVYLFNATSGDIMRSYPTGGPVRSSPAILYNTIYVNSLDGYVYAFDLNSTNQLWSTQIYYESTYGWIASSPAVSNEHVYIGALNNYVYCLDAFNGTEKWQFETGYRIMGSPCIYDNNIYIPSQDDVLYCLNSSNGDHQWHFDTDDEGYFRSSPVIADEKIYFIIGEGIIHCLDIHQNITDRVIWTYDSKETGLSSPIIADGLLYVGGYESDEYSGTLLCFGDEKKPPRINFTMEPHETKTFNPISFNDSSYDEDGYITNWSWDFGDGNTSYIKNTTHKYTDNGEYTIHLEITDNDGLTNTSEKNITIVNRKPLIRNDSAVTSRNTSVNIDVLQNDEDYDGVLNRSSLSIIELPEHGIVSINQTVFNVTYTPSEWFIGNDTFIYEISDDDNATAQGTVLVNVTPEEKPIGVNDFYNINEDEILVVPQPGVLENDDDPNEGPDPLSAILILHTNHGDIQLNENGSFEYAPDAHYFGNDSFKYQAYDGLYYSDNVTVYIMLHSINDPPIAKNDSYLCSINSEKIMNVTANDVDIDGVLNHSSLMMVDNSNHGDLHFNDSTGFITYTPDDDFYGDDFFSYTIEDNEGNQSNIAYVTIEVLDNRTPTASFTYTPKKPVCNQEIKFKDTSTNEDGNIIQWTWFFGDGQMSTEQHPTYQYDTEGTYSVQLTVKNDNGKQDSIQKEITINNNTEAPEALEVSILYPNQNDVIQGTIVIKGKATKGENDIEKVEITIDNENWIVANGTEEWHYQWNTTKVENGQYQIMVRCFDGSEYSKTQSIMVSVQNEEPALDDSAPTVQIDNPVEGSMVSNVIWINGTALDDNQIEFVEITIQNQPWIRVTGKNKWTYQLNTTGLSNGECRISARSYDGNQYSDVEVIHIIIENDNETSVEIQESKTDNDSQDDSSFMIFIIILLLSSIIAMGVIIQVMRI